MLSSCYRNGVVIFSLILLTYIYSYIPHSCCTYRIWYLQLHHIKTWWYWSMTWSKAPPLLAFVLIRATPEIGFSSADSGKDSPHRRHQLGATSLVVSFHSEVFSSCSQPMRREQLLEAGYQMNSVVCPLARRRAFECLSPLHSTTPPPTDCPMCCFSEPTSWNVHIL